MYGQSRQPKIGAFTPPPGGKINIGGQEIVTRDFRTLSRYKEYARCGFEEILFAGENKYCGEPFAASGLKKMLDLAAQAKLRAIVYDDRLIRLTREPKEKLVGEMFATQADLNAYVADCLQVYADHPAFYGISAADEPNASRAHIFHEFCTAIYAFRKDIYVHTCCLPMANNSAVQLALGSENNAEKDYADYIDAMCATGLGYFCYDAYPFGMWEGKNDMREGYIRNMQIAALQSASNGVPFYMTIQSFSSGENDELRRVDQDDLRWQANIALGFGCKKIYYFTYWRFTTRPSSDFFTSAIMDEDGKRLLYGAAKQNNAYVLRLFALLEKYSYVRSQFCGDLCGYKAAKWLKSEQIGMFAGVESTAPVLINELAGGDARAYMILNLRDPFEKEKNCVSLKFAENISTVKAFCRGKLKDMRLKADVLKCALRPGEALWLFLDDFVKC